MQTYELTLVLPAKTTPAKKKTVQGDIEKVITVNKGKVVKLDDWGERQLAYPIAKNRSGMFLHFTLELEKAAAPEIDAKMRVNEDVIRYLLVKS